MIIIITSHFIMLNMVMAETTTTKKHRKHLSTPLARIHCVAYVMAHSLEFIIVNSGMISIRCAMMDANGM